jgi:hypothetical protein
MTIFPTLRSGAVMQFPAPLVLSQSAAVVQFLDGEEQRFLTQGRTFRRWLIRLESLSDVEAGQIEAFFQQQYGTYSSFGFPDPFSGMLVPNCRFVDSGLTMKYQGPDSNSAEFTVQECNE